MIKRWASRKSLSVLPEEEEDTELTRAVLEGDLERVRRLIRKGARVNDRNPRDSSTALMVAAGLDLTDVASLLLRRGARIHKRTISPEKNATTGAPGGWQALHFAAAAGATRTARLLLMRKADVNARTDSGLTPLALSVTSAAADVDLVSLLLESGADPDLGDDANDLNEDEGGGDVEVGSGITPLTRAVMANRVDVAKLLLEKGARVNRKESRFGLTPLMAAIISRNGEGNDEMVDLLLEHGARPNSAIDSEVWSPVSAAAHLGLHSAAESLLHSGGDPQRGGRHATSAVMRAVANGDERMVRLLLEHDSTLVDSRDLQGLSPILRAAELGLHRIVETLLDHGADPNDSIEYEHSDRARAAVRAEFGESALAAALVSLAADVGARRGATALCLAARQGNARTVRHLLEGGAYVSRCSHSGVSPLHQAVSCGHRKVAKMLIHDGAEVNASDCDGVTALMSACVRADLRLARLLLRHGAAVGFEDRRGNTALSYASGNVKLLRALAEEEGASVDVRSFDGRTPLFNAVEYNSPKAVRYLLDAGVHVNARQAGNGSAGAGGRTALDAAVTLGRRDVARILVEYGAVRGNARLAAVAGGKDACCAVS